MRKLRVAFIGAGARSRVYAQAWRACADIEVVALADPDAGSRQALLAELRPDASAEQFENWRALLAEHPQLDGVVISTPNHLHAAQAVPCLERGLPVALEKPLAITPADCERILDAEQAAGGRVLLGFVLRSTPFYIRIRELIAAGAIGRVTAIQADELVGVETTRLMTRSPWRRFSAASGGALLEKCCHDMDLLSWMMDCRPVSLASQGGTLVFQPDTTLPETCPGCPRADECRYYEAPPAGAAARCVYNIEKDIVDTQSVCVQYENGAVASFLLHYNCPGQRGGRNFHAIGTGGRIWGNFEEASVSVYNNSSGQVTVYETPGDGSGHGGGDQPHALELRRMMLEPGYRPAHSAAAGYLSAVMCFAADLARTEGRTVALGYEPDGRIILS